MHNVLVVFNGAQWTLIALTVIISNVNCGIVRWDLVNTYGISCCWDLQIKEELLSRLSHLIVIYVDREACHILSSCEDHGVLLRTTVIRTSWRGMEYGNWLKHQKVRYFRYSIPIPRLQQCTENYLIHVIIFKDNEIGLFINCVLHDAHQQHFHPVRSHRQKRTSYGL